MNTFDDTLEDVEIYVNGRRKRADKSKHSREIAKKARLSCGGNIPTINCQHQASNSICFAEFLTSGDMTLNQDRFYANTSKVGQGAYLLRLLQVRDAMRVCVKEDERKRKCNTSTTFSLLTSHGQGQVRVCQATFCCVLGIKVDRVTRVARYYNEKKEARPGNRGGRRYADMDGEKCQVMISHIKSFKCKPSHYSRKSSPGRKYLPCDLSIARMYQMFREQHHATSSYSLYYSVFTGSFNLGFGHPASDVCGTCLQFKAQVRDTNVDEEHRKVLAAELILHRRRARQFYNLMNHVGDTFTICFDVMENLVLPKTPVGQAFYSRQLYLYVFGVVIHRADGSQRKEDIHMYTWLEHQNRKDSNMIASAVQPFLLDVLPKHIENRSELRLFS